VHTCWPSCLPTLLCWVASRGKTHLHLAPTNIPFRWVKSYAELSRGLGTTKFDQSIGLVNALHRCGILHQLPTLLQYKNNHCIFISFRLSFCRSSVCSWSQLHPECALILQLEVIRCRSNAMLHNVFPLVIICVVTFCRITAAQSFRRE
jgi:hypothetical protein